jgi:hypothetical protein
MTANWAIVRDCYMGEAQVKSKRIIYLPPTQGMILDGMANANQLGYQTYEAYKMRAVWHDLYKEAIEAYIGLLHQKPATITLPNQMKDVRSNMGETPLELLRRINEEQLVSGRLGLLVDLPVAPEPAGPLPYVAMYLAEFVRNWDIGEDTALQASLNFVILDESGYTRDTNINFGWINQVRYRLCQLGDITTSDAGNYMTGLYKVTGVGSPTYDPKLMATPLLRGVPMKKIPFTFVDTKDLLASIDLPPLLGLANIMLTIYRSEADYRQNLFMQGQDTLVTIGTIGKKDPTNPDAPLRTGAGSRIEMDQGGDAKYIGVNSSGLPEQRSAIQNDRSRAEVRAGQLINARVGDKESGEALKTRLAAQTATLKQIALAGAAGLQEALQNVAIWMGLDPATVKIEPNLEFSSTLITGQDMFQLMQAKDLGMPISYESIHAYMVDRGITTMNFDDELATILKERQQVQLLKDPVAQQQQADQLKAQQDAAAAAARARPPAPNGGTPSAR